MLQFNHFNFNVLDLERSLAFYRQALELETVREKTARDGSFRLVYHKNKYLSEPLRHLMDCMRQCAMTPED